MLSLSPGSPSDRTVRNPRLEAVRRGFPVEGEVCLKAEPQHHWSPSLPSEITKITQKIQKIHEALEKKTNAGKLGPRDVACGFFLGHGGPDPAFSLPHPAPASK